MQTLQILGFGAITGVRGLLGVTLVNAHLRRTAPRSRLASARASRVLGIIATTEILADKLPGLPARIAPPLLAARSAGGAVVGGVVGATDGHAAAGALIGCAAAVAAAFVSYRVRMTLSRTLPVPDPIIGILEDVLLLAAGRALLESGSGARA